MCKGPGDARGYFAIQGRIGYGDARPTGASADLPSMAEGLIPCQDDWRFPAEPTNLAFEKEIFHDGQP